MLKRRTNAGRDEKGTGQRIQNKVMNTYTAEGLLEVCAGFEIIARRVLGKHGFKL